MENINFFDPKKAEKEEIKKAANLSGAAYSAMLVGNEGLTLLLFAVLAIFGYGIIDSVGILMDNTVLLLLQIVFSASMFTIPYILVMKIGKIKISEIAQYGRPKKKMFWPLVALGMGVCELGEITTYIFLEFLDFIGFKASYDLGFVYKTDPLTVSLMVLAVAVLPALVEEFAMRGVLLGMLRRYGEGFAIILSSFIFGIMHGNFVQIPFAFVVGLGLGFIAIKSGSVWTASLVHFINNFFSVVLDYLDLSLSGYQQDIVHGSLSVFWIIVGIIGTVVASRRDENLFKLEKGNLSATLSEKLTWSATSPFIIISVIMTIAQIVLTEVMP